MSLSAVLGQARAVESLRSALRAQAVHHAYLFVGPDGVGRELTAIGLVQALFCAQKPGEGCGACAVCRRVEGRNHPDVTWVMPEEEQIVRGLAGRSDFAGTPSRELRVEQIRQLQERLSFRPLEAGRKVAIFCSAEQLNPQAQNALLKTLEEPPSDTTLILIASSPDRLLPTLRSRCLTLPFYPLPRAQVAATVREKRKVDDATALLVAELSGGSLSQALALDVDTLSRRGEVIDRFEALTPEDARTVLRFAEDFGAKRDDAEDALKILEWWLRDLAVVQAGGAQIVNRDLLARAQASAPRYLPASLQRRRELIDETADALLRNGAPRLALERMLIGMLREAGGRP